MKYTVLAAHRRSLAHCLGSWEGGSLGSATGAGGWVVHRMPQRNRSVLEGRACRVAISPHRRYVRLPQRPVGRVARSSPVACEDLWLGAAPSGRGVAALRFDDKDWSAATTSTTASNPSGRVPARSLAVNRKCPGCRCVLVTVSATAGRTPDGRTSDPSGAQQNRAAWKTGRGSAEAWWGTREPLGRVSVLTAHRAPGGLDGFSDFFPSRGVTRYG